MADEFNTPADTFARNSVKVKQASGGTWSGAGGEEGETRNFVVDNSALEAKTAQWLEAAATMEQIVKDLTGHEISVKTIGFEPPSMEVSDVPQRYKPFKWRRMIVTFED